MTSTLKRVTAAAPSSREIGDALTAGSIKLNDADFTDNEYQVAPDHYAMTIAVGALVASEKTITLPTGSATLDGFYIRVYNDSFYNLTVKPDRAVPIWNSGNGYGIDLPNKGTLVKLVYLHALGKWVIQEKTGGKVLIEGLKFFVPMDKLYAWDNLESVSYSGIEDKTGRHYGFALGDLQSYTEYSAKFPPGCFRFDGNGDYIGFYVSPDWNIFGDQIGRKTVSFWVYHVSSGSSEKYLAQTNSTADSSNRFYFSREAGGSLNLFYTKSGTTQISLSSGSISATIWTNVAMIIDGPIVGLYINGNQVGFTESWDTQTFSGSLNIGQNAFDTGYFNGCMQDLHISYNNPYNANPNSDNSDSFPVPAAPFEGVMT